MLVTDIHERSQNLRHLEPGMGLKMGVLGFFLEIKVTVVRQVRMSPHPLRSEPEDKTHLKCHMTRKDRGRIGCAFGFACVVDKNPKTPKLSSMADDAFTWGGIGGLGSLVYICGASRCFAK